MMTDDLKTSSAEARSAADPDEQSRSRRERKRTAQTVTNFGANIRFQPYAVEAPRDECELIDCLSHNPGRPVRCVGSRHAWSPLIETSGTLLSLEHFNAIELVDVDGQRRVRVGAGCQIKKLVAFLNDAGLTLPSLGLIDEQTIAGATATGTHGSGRHSLSHYVQAVRLVHCAAGSREFEACWIRDDPEALRAARCSLGALGVITELELAVRPQYQIEEHFTRQATLEEVLALEAQYPLQQFYFVPWRWDFFVQHRREVDAPPSRLAPLYRAFWLLGMDLGMHLVIVALARYLPWHSSQFVFRYVLPLLIPRGWKVVDRSDRQLTMQHEWFRHIELELFVPRSRLANLLKIVRHELEQSSHRSIDRYEHHYPICVRKVEGDDTLISASSSGTEPWYAVSLISYAKPTERVGFYSFADQVATQAAEHCGARPHWGKHCPLSTSQVRQLYPQLPEFLAIARRFDPSGRFSGSWLRGLLGPHQGIESADEPPCATGPS